MAVKGSGEAIRNVSDTIETWKNKCKTGAAVFAGTKSLKGWKPGKVVTEEEYISAVSDFCTSSISKKEV